MEGDYNDASSEQSENEMLQSAMNSIKRLRKQMDKLQVASLTPTFVNMQFNQAS